MRYSDRWGLYLVALALAACQPAIEIPTPVVPTPAPEVASFDAAFSTPTPSPPAAIVLPPPPSLPPRAFQFLLSTGGRELVLEFETGGRSGYDPHPEWPGGASGVTIGIGYDMGYYSKAVIDSDWQAINKTPRTRLLSVAGLSGTRARHVLSTVRDIYVQWDIAADVFDRVDVAREFSRAKRAVPGFEDMRPNAQAAWLSLGFNRGWQLSGPNRLEMRAARDLVPGRDYEGMAVQFRKMVRVWAGTQFENGMRRRRFAEADLLLTP